MKNEARLFLALNQYAINVFATPNSTQCIQSIGNTLLRSTYFSIINGMAPLIPFTYLYTVNKSLKEFVNHIVHVHLLPFTNHLQQWSLYICIKNN